jgi:hypothetical protein
MAYGLWDQIQWLTTRVKRLCCAVDKNTAAIAQAAISNPPYFEVSYVNGPIDDGWTKLSFANDDMGSNFTSMINVGNTQRFYGGSNISLTNPVSSWTNDNFTKSHLISINDIGGAIVEVGNNIFQDCESLEYLNLPKAQILGEHVFQSCGVLKYVNLPSTKTLGLESFNSSNALQTLNINKCTSMGTDVFININGTSVTITLPSSLVTNPNIVALSLVNDVTLNIV